MATFENNREPRKPIKMSIYYDVVAGLLYVFLAYYLYTRPPGGISPKVIEIVRVIFGIYGFFRIGRGVYRLTKK